MRINGPDYSDKFQDTISRNIISHLAYEVEAPTLTVLGPQPTTQNNEIDSPCIDGCYLLVDHYLSNLNTSSIWGKGHWVQDLGTIWRVIGNLPTKIVIQLVCSVYKDETIKMWASL